METANDTINPFNSNLSDLVFQGDLKNLVINSQSELDLYYYEEHPELDRMRFSGSGYYRLFIASIKHGSYTDYKQAVGIPIPRPYVDPKMKQKKVDAYAGRLAVNMTDYIMGYTALKRYDAPYLVGFLVPSIRKDISNETKCEDKFESREVGKTTLHFEYPPNITKHKDTRYALYPQDAAYLRDEKNTRKLVHEHMLAGATSILAYEREFEKTIRENYKPLVNQPA